MFDRCYCIKHLSRLMTKPTKWLCAQRRLRSARHPPNLIRVFAVHVKKAWVLSYPLSAQRRLWSNWADAQADLSLRRAHSHFVGFVMRQLILPCKNRRKHWRVSFEKCFLLSRPNAAKCHVLKLLLGSVITLCWRHEITLATVHVLVLTADFVTAPECL